MTDEARDAFTAEHMGEAWVHALHFVKTHYGQHEKAWLYDARIALEEKLGYVLSAIGPQNQWMWTRGEGVTYAPTCDAAIEAAAQHWWEQQ